MSVSPVNLSDSNFIYDPKKNTVTFKHAVTSAGIENDKRLKTALKKVDITIGKDDLFGKGTVLGKSTKIDDGDVIGSGVTLKANTSLKSNFAVTESKGKLTETTTIPKNKAWSYDAAKGTVTFNKALTSAQIAKGPALENLLKALGTTIGKDDSFGAHTTIGARVTIGHNDSFGTNSFIDAETKIGSYDEFGHGTRIVDGYLQNNFQDHIAYNTIGDGVYFGYDDVIKNGSVISNRFNAGNHDTFNNFSWVKTPNPGTGFGTVEFWENNLNLFNNQTLHGKNT